MNNRIDGMIAQIRAKEGELSTMRLKESVMWDELTKLALNHDGYEGQAICQIMDDYQSLRRDICIKCGKYAETDGCAGCRWKETK